MQELRREVAILQRVSADANVVQFYGAVLPDGSAPSSTALPAMLVMEYLAVSGQSTRPIHAMHTGSVGAVSCDHRGGPAVMRDAQALGHGAHNAYHAPSLQSSGTRTGDTLQTSSCIGMTATDVHVAGVD